MRILVVGLVKNPQLLRLKEEAQKRGHELDGCYSSDLTFYIDPANAKLELKNKDIYSYDLIYIWAISTRRWDWLSCIKYLSDIKKIHVVNGKMIDPTYLYYTSPLMDFIKQYKEKLPFPKSALLMSDKTVDQVISDFKYPLVVKPSSGSKGKNVSLVKEYIELKNKVKELLETEPSVIIREYIPNDGDIRIFTVGYRAIGAMKRTPTKEGEFRSNISLGGKGSVYDLKSNREVKDIAEKLSELTRTEIAGVDIIIHIETQEPYILEINPGPQFTGFEKYTGINAAEKIIKYFESLLK